MSGLYRSDELYERVSCLLDDINALFEAEPRTWEKMEKCDGRFSSLASRIDKAQVELWPQGWDKGYIWAEYIFNEEGWVPITLDIFAPHVDVGAEEYEAFVVGCRVTLLNPHVIGIMDSEETLFEMLPSRTGKASQAILSAILNAENERSKWDVQL